MKCLHFPTNSDLKFKSLLLFANTISSLSKLQRAQIFSGLFWLGHVQNPPDQNPPDQHLPDRNPPGSKSTRSKPTRFKIHPIKIHPSHNQSESKSTRVKIHPIKINLFNSTQVNGRSELHLAFLQGLTI